MKRTEKREKVKIPEPPTKITSQTQSFHRLELLGKGGFAYCYRVVLDGAHITPTATSSTTTSATSSTTTSAGDATSATKTISTQKQGSQFAVKSIYKPSITSQKQTQKLLSEIKIHSILHHKHIVSFFDCFEDSDFVYFILELCEYKSLVEVVRTRVRLTEVEVKMIMFQLFQGIQYLHRKGFIHRDLKLGNLFLSGSDVVGTTTTTSDGLVIKIGDFGLSTEMNDDGARKKTICGTPNYIAPEILFNVDGHSFEVDIWSLGVVLYTLLIGIHS
jgi:serine/threonine protein kinase